MPHTSTGLENIPERRLPWHTNIISHNRNNPYYYDGSDGDESTSLLDRHGTLLDIVSLSEKACPNSLSPLLLGRDDFIELATTSLAHRCEEVPVSFKDQIRVEARNPHLATHQAVAGWGRKYSKMPFTSLLRDRWSSTSQKIGLSCGKDEISTGRYHNCAVVV